MNEKVGIVGRKVAKKVSYRPTIAYFPDFVTQKIRIL